MNIHIIVDFQYNYYRHKREIDGGMRAKLSCNVEGDIIDTTGAYLTLKDVESIRREWADKGHEVTMSICFDSKSERKEEDKEYKADRGTRLNDYDFSSIDLARSILADACYNVYKEDGKEADDLIYNLVQNFKDQYEATVIYTVDADLLVNLDSNVGLMRYKANLKGYMFIKPSNFSQIMEAEYKCYMPYNCILLYKCLCGDKSDKIKGVKGFGPSAFSKLVCEINSNNKIYGEADSKYVDYAKLVDYKYVQKVLLIYEGYLGHKAYEEAMEALELIKPRETVDTNRKPVKADSFETRQKAYLKYMMKSLIK